MLLQDTTRTAILIMTFLPHKHITTHYGDTETQRKIEGQISYLNVAERRFLEI